MAAVSSHRNYNSDWVGSIDEFFRWKDVLSYDVHFKVVGSQIIETVLVIIRWVAFLHKFQVTKIGYNKCVVIVHAVTILVFNILKHVLR